MSDTYILIGQTPVKEPDIHEWARAFESMDRIVAQTPIEGGMVSTVFLGLDHNHFGGGPPLLFETMVFRNDESERCERCSTWLEAEDQHARIVIEEQVRQS